MLPKQAQKLLDFIYEYKAENDGNAPPHRVMFLAIDAHSSNASAYWVDFLVEKGILTKKRGRLCVVGARWVPPSKCTWKYREEHAMDYWETGCGEAFGFVDGTPQDSDVRFCSSCGLKIKHIDEGIKNEKGE